MGTGTSQGVPIIGCQCEVCRSNDPRDARLRASALVEYGGLNILVDAGPDFRTQMVRAGVRHLDAIHPRGKLHRSTSRRRRNYRP